MINEQIEKELAIEHLDDLTQSVAYYLELKGQHTSAAKQMEEIKARIDRFLNEHQELFAGESSFNIKEGRIVIANNPPRAVWAETGIALSTEERREFADKLPDSYRTLQIDMLKVAKAKASDKRLRTVLKASCIDIVQDTRYDIKQPVQEYKLKAEGGQ